MSEALFGILLVTILLTVVMAPFLWVTHWLSKTWTVIGQGEIERVTVIPAVAPMITEPFFGPYLTRGCFEVDFADGEKCVAIGRVPPGLEPGQRVRISQNMLGDTLTENI